MKTNKLFLCLAIALVLAVGAAASAEPNPSQWNGYYCNTSFCGVNYYNNNYGWNPGNYCPVVNYSAPFQAEFIKDVTYPDGTYVVPGTTFTKTWRLRNVGTQAWNTGTKLVFISGDPMAAVGGSIPYYVAPGNSVDVSVRLTAPANGGSVTGSWMLQAPDGTLFGVGCNGQTPIWVSVRTWTGGACSCLGQPICNCKAPSYKPGRNPYCNNKIRDIKDVTFPDGSVVAPGAVFRKTWRMKNGGTCVWDQNYLVSFFYGDDLGFDGQVYFQKAGTDNSSYNGQKYQINRNKSFYIYPGEYVYVSIDLQAPTAPGMYESYFKLRDNYGYEFGFGSYADAAFWVNINVVKEAPKSGDGIVIVGDVPLQDKNTGDPEVIEAQVVNPASGNQCALQNPKVVSTDTGYQVLWEAVNQGTTLWDGYTLIKADSNPALSFDSASFAIPTTAPGETASLTFNVNLDSSQANADPLWMEFYISSGAESFCDFYFEAPAK